MGKKVPKISKSAVRAKEIRPFPTPLSKLRGDAPVLSSSAKHRDCDGELYNGAPRAFCGIFLCTEEPSGYHQIRL